MITEKLQWCRPLDDGTHFGSWGGPLLLVASRNGIRMGTEGNLFIVVLHYTCIERNIKSYAIPEKFTEMDIVANAYILFIAGFETVSTSMSFCMYELALKKDVQDKVRKEILDVKAKYNGQINSESINELHYMGMVIKGK